MGNKDQALIAHTKKGRRDYNHPKGKHSHQNQKDNPRRYNRDLSKIRFYTCDEKGHFAREFPRNKGGSHKKKGNKRIHHAHTTKYDEPPRKRVKEECKDSLSDEEDVFIYALT